MAFCPACGAQSNDAGAFCTSCGKPSAASASAPAAAHGAPTEPRAGVVEHPPARPIGVTIVGVVLVAVGALVALATFALLLFVFSFEAASQYIPFFSEMMGLFNVIMLFVALAGLAMAAVVGTVGIATLQGRAWAWVGVLVLMGLNALREIASLAQQEVQAVIGLLVSGVVIWYFFTPEVRRYFGQDT